MRWIKAIVRNLRNILNFYAMLLFGNDPCQEIIVEINEKIDKEQQKGKSMTEAQIITEAARRIGTKPEWLDALINFETGGTYSTNIKNPRSSAIGLIQLTNAPARDMGFADSTAAVEAYPDFKSQMFNIVVPYFEMKKKQNGIDNYMKKQSLYMAVFYPAYWDWPADSLFPIEVRNVNPGINTPQDYINFVDKRIKTDTLKVASSVSLVLIAGLATAAYLMYRYKVWPFS